MLTQEQIKECQLKFNLSYHVNYAKVCQDLIGFEGKNVLEVGGSLPPDFVFDYLGVKSWTGIETPDYEKSLRETGGLTHQGTIIKEIKNIEDFKYKNKQQEKYNLYLENIEDLPENFYDQYDLIFSIATFEHIHKLPLALDKMFYALKDGGNLFSMFSPIWSAYDGHHLPKIKDQRGNEYNFGNSPIPPWGHLLMSRGEMAEYLYKKMDKAIADQIVYHVYQSNHINRYFTEDYLQIIKQSLFKINKLELTFNAKIDFNLHEKLCLTYPKNKKFTNNGVLLYLEKDKKKRNQQKSKIDMNNYFLENQLNQAHQYFNQQEFSKAAQLYLQLINENPQLKPSLSIRLAHCLILEANWQQISNNLIQGINYLSTSGWLNSLFQSKPVNAENKPIPWYTYPAIEFLEDKIKHDSIVFEFGGGNSTLWWANKAKQVISIESDQGWYEQIKQQMPDNVELNLEIEEKKYADFINQYPDQYFDVIIVDGINRNSCLENSLNKLKNDGLLIFDNTDDHRYDSSLKLLSSQGYKRIDFYGLIPSYTYKNCTSIFFKSTEILETKTLPSNKKSDLGKSCMQITSPKPTNMNDNDEYKDNWQLTAPVAFIIFNRPDTTQKVFNAIREAKPPKLLVIADGARHHKEGEAELCQQTRAIIEQVDWDCEVLVNYSDVNLGCRKRVSSGLDWVFEQVEEAIILEDDCLPHPTFFRYCQELLEKYRDDERIMMISGDNFQFGRKRTEYSYYFSRYGHIWGWASWKRAWQKNDDSMKLWQELRDTNWLHNFLENEQATAYWSRIFQSVYDGFDTWDYIWLFTLWANNGLTILPNVNLISNIGFGSGTHTTSQNSPLADMPLESLSFPLSHPPYITRNTDADDFTEKTLFSKAEKQNLPVSKNNQISMENLIELINNNKNQEVINLINSNQNSSSNSLYIKALAEIRLEYIYEAKNSLNQLLSKNAHHVKARQLLNEISQDSEKEVQQLINQALNYFNQGERIKALRMGEKASSLGVFVPGLHYFRSVFNSAVARYEEALEAAELELKFNPNHTEAQQKVASLRQALIKPKKEKIPNEKRAWNTSLPHDLMMSIQNSLHNYSYSGVPTQKNPFDFAIYPVLIWHLKPRTIIEIGSKSGGSALWYGDLFDNFKIDGHIYSVDIVKVTKYSHPRVTFLEGDGQNLQETFSPDFLKQLPRPLLIIEDADHSYQTSKAVLDFFHPYLDKDEYIVIEDGIISDIVKDATYSSGPHKALKHFLADHNSEYDIDDNYCDFFGYNLTWATNGYLKKLTLAQIKPVRETAPLTPTLSPQQPTSKLKWLNLGCGGCFHPDWTNVDFNRTGETVIPHNLLKGIPFADNSFEVVYHSHLLEHLPKNEALPFLTECHRVLQPNGIIRVVIPDLEQIARLYLQSLENALNGSETDAHNYNWLMLEMYDQVVRNESGGDMKRYLAQNPLPNPEFIVGRFGVEGEMLINAFQGRNFPSKSLAELNPTQIGQFRQGGEVHQWMYDRYSLKVLLEKVGFMDVKVCQANESRINGFNNYQLDVLADGKVRKSDSLFMEGIKPEN